MAEVSAHKEGMPAWVELATSDAEGALRFYGALLGWEDDPQPMGPDMVHHMQRLRGLEVGGIYQQGAGEKAQGFPPQWRTYFAAASADDAAKRATDAGGTLVAGPFDIFDSGRMAIAQDPQGAVFGIWQAKQRIGYRIVSEPGALTWNELVTTDPEQAASFYAGVFNVSTEKMPGPMDYTLLRVEGQPAAGILQLTPAMGPMPPCWGVYFMVANVDDSARQAQTLGATVLAAPQDIPAVGRFAVLQDPQGAVFSIFLPDQALWDTAAQQPR